MSKVFDKFSSELYKKYGLINDPPSKNVFSDIGSVVSSKIDTSIVFLSDINTLKRVISSYLSNLYFSAILLGNKMSNPKKHVYTISNIPVNSYNYSLYKDRILARISTYNKPLDYNDNLQKYVVLDVIEKLFDRFDIKKDNFMNYLETSIESIVNSNFDNIKDYNKFKHVEKIEFSGNNTIDKFEIPMNSCVVSESFISLIDFKLARLFTLCLIETYMYINNLVMIDQFNSSNIFTMNDFNESCKKIQIINLKNAYVKITFPVLLSDNILNAYVFKNDIAYNGLESIFLKLSSSKISKILNNHYLKENYGIMAISDFVNIKIYLPVNEMVSVPDNMKIVNINNEPYAVHNLIFSSSVHSSIPYIVKYSKLLYNLYRNGLFILTPDKKNLVFMGNNSLILPKNNKFIKNEYVNLYVNHYKENLEFFTSSQHSDDLHKNTSDIILFKKLFDYADKTSDADKNIFENLYKNAVKFMSHIYKSAKETLQIRYKNNNIKLKSCLKNINIMSVLSLQGNIANTVSNNIIIDNELFYDNKFVINNTVTSKKLIVKHRLRSGLDAFKYSIFNPYGYSRFVIKSDIEPEFKSSYFPKSFKHYKFGQKSNSKEFIVNPFINDDLNKYFNITLNLNENKINIEINKSIIIKYLNKIRHDLLTNKDLSKNLLFHFIMSSMNFLTPKLINLYYYSRTIVDISSIIIRNPFSKYLPNEIYFEYYKVIAISDNIENIKKSTKIYDNIFSKLFYYDKDGYIVVGNNKLYSPIISTIVRHTREYDVMDITGDTTNASEISDANYPLMINTEFDVIGIKYILMDSKFYKENEILNMTINELEKKIYDEMQSFQEFVFNNLVKIIDKRILKMLVEDYMLKPINNNNKYKIVINNDNIGSLVNNVNKIWKNIFGENIKYENEFLYNKLMIIFCNPKLLLEFANGLILGYISYRLFMNLINNNDIDVEDIKLSIPVDNKWMMDYIFNNLLEMRHKNLDNFAAHVMYEENTSKYFNLQERIYALLHLNVILNLNYDFINNKIKLECLPTNTIAEIFKSIYENYTSDSRMSNIEIFPKYVPRLMEKSIEEYLKRFRSNSFNLVFYIPLIDKFLANVSKVSGGHIDATLNSLLNINNDVLEKHDAYNKISKLYLQLLNTTRSGS